MRKKKKKKKSKMSRDQNHVERVGLLRISTIRTFPRCRRKNHFNRRQLLEKLQLFKHHGRRLFFFTVDKRRRLCFFFWARDVFLFPKWHRMKHDVQLSASLDIDLPKVNERKKKKIYRKRGSKPKDIFSQPTAKHPRATTGQKIKIVPG